MQRRFIVLTATLAVLLSTFFVSSAASAETASRATVPFAFSANDLELPAGAYDFVLRDDNFLALVNRETGKMAVFLVRTTSSNHKIAKGSLQFHSDGQKYQLTEVRFANSNQETELAVQPKPGREIDVVNSHNPRVAISTR
jgi:hypothetical protein